MRLYIILCMVSIHLITIFILSCFNAGIFASYFIGGTIALTINPISKYFEKKK